MKGLLQKTGYIAVLALLATYAVAALRGPNGVQALLEKRRQISALQEQNATLAAQNQQMADRIEKLKNDRNAQELEIKKKLKLLKRNETQLILPEKSEPEKAEPAPAK